MTELKVLILDDNNLTARAIANVAEFIGLSAKITSDFQSFLEIINDWSPQYLIIDLIMPDMDGVEVLGELGRMQIDAQLIITSGAGQQLLHAAARSAGAHGLNVLGILPKPFNPKAFRDLINAESINTADNTFGQQLRAENQTNTLTVNELEQAINAHDIYLVYQPKVSCVSGTLTGLEALARWQHAEKGFISPEKFIPLAEQNDLIDKLTLQVFE
ncbi:MAG TPA: diguanylate cyclase, partial [Methylophaga sp.]|nr:diguanylate cyclase [Methylophaga sp.]